MSTHPSPSPPPPRARHTTDNHHTSSSSPHHTSTTVCTIPIVIAELAKNFGQRERHGGRQQQRTLSILRKGTEQLLLNSSSPTPCAVAY
ncbi:hypothetical protein TIFTF001_032601 [Ficus carica]|uniref:Uncharacterized protein n=1 Tax=Ficus carica TaxID=3494 RepID=A0AA88J607_FICCA|nr:hypothetical protein TIFTF001_032601 [Ficus carica]